jgi:hypothetical protein
MPSVMLVVLSLLAAVPEAAPASAPPATDKPDRESARKELVAKMAHEVVEGYEVTQGKATPAKLVLQKEPILRWSNPAAGSIYGDVYVWTSQGRPEVLASIYRWYHPYRSQTAEIHSLASGDVAITSKNGKIWSPAKPGVEFQAIPEAAAPAETPLLRLQQMRRLAKEFSVKLLDTREEKEKGVSRELRMLNQPVYRYSSQHPDVLDGAMFAFVEGTDPEAWLLLEARKKDGKANWQFALARMNNDELHGYYKEAEVWKVSKTNAPWQNPRELTYALFFIRDIPWEDVPEVAAAPKEK